MVPSHSGILAESISKKYHHHRRHHYYSQRHHSHLTKQNTCPHEHQHLLPHLDLTCHPLTYIFNNDIAITLHLLPHSSSSRCCRNSNNWYFGGNLTVSTIAQRSYNHLVILKHRHNNNEHNYNNIQKTQHLFRYPK